MVIPKQFELFGNTIKVVMDNDKMDYDLAYGLAEYKTDTIYLTAKAHGKPISKAELQRVFIHEVLHFILHRLDYDKLNNDDVFINRMAGAIHQILKSAK